MNPPVCFRSASARLNRVWSMGALVLLLAVARGEDTLQSLFSDEEIQRAGLAKLSPEEQAALLQALHQRGLGVPDKHPAPAAAPKMDAPREDTLKVAAAKEAAPKVAAPREKKGFWARIKDFGAEQLPVKNAKDEGEVVEVAAQMTEPFRGLHGGTMFHLDNGQVWQQRIPENYYLGKSIPNPKITIQRTRFGYRLLIPAVEPNFAVAVKRIE